MAVFVARIRKVEKEPPRTAEAVILEKVLQKFGDWEKFWECVSPTLLAKYGASCSKDVVEFPSLRTVFNFFAEALRDPSVRALYWLTKHEYDFD